MKRLIFFLTLLISTLLVAKLPVIVSILPLKTFTEAIGGGNAVVTVMVQPGSSPHTYEPKPSQMKDIAHAKLYLAIGVEFEDVWLPKFHALNPQLPIVDVGQGITRRMMHELHPDPGEKPTHLDPHIWTTPANVRVIAKNILTALTKADPAHTEAYQKNYQNFLQKIDQTDAAIRATLSGLPKGTKFMVFHPSWGYFAEEYGLTQLPVQVAGKNPKPRELIALIKRAKAQHVRAIFTQPEFSDTTAKVLAKELHIPVRKVSPMAPNWADNLIHLSHDIADKGK